MFSNLHIFLENMFISMQYIACLPVQTIARMPNWHSCNDSASADFKNTFFITPNYIKESIKT